MIKLLEAAESAQSVFSTMFPEISETVFQDTLNGLIQGHKIVLIETENGVYLQITDDGAILKGELETASRKDKDALNGFLIGTATSLLGTMIFEVINYIVAHPEWAQSIFQFLSSK